MSAFLFTFGFIGTELLVDGAVEAYPHVGIAVVAAAALSGIAVVRVFFLLFTGTHYTSTVSLLIGTRERIAVRAIAALILIGGIVPQSIVASRHLAAEEILRGRMLVAGGGLSEPLKVAHETPASACVAGRTTGGRNACRRTVPCRSFCRNALSRLAHNKPSVSASPAHLVGHGGPGFECSKNLPDRKVLVRFDYGVSD